jgi:hypothetical protein
MEIKFKKESKKGKFYFSIEIDGQNVESMPRDNVYEASRELTGSTSESISGVFNNASDRYCFYYGEYSKEFSFHPLFEKDIPVSETAKRFKRRISEVRKWIASLPKDSIEEVILEY